MRVGIKVVAMADTIITGVISNFIFASISAATPEKLRRLTPALFYGGKAALEAADTAFLNAKDEILDKFGKRMEVVRFLSPEKTLHGGVLNPLFENIFHHKPLGAVLAKRDAWARIAGCMREEAGSVVGSVIV